MLCFFNKVTVLGSPIHIMFAALRYPQKDVNSDTNLVHSFLFVQDLGVLERAFSHFGTPLFKIISASYEAHRICRVGSQ